MAATPTIPSTGAPIGVAAPLDHRQLTARERRWLRARWTRWLLAGAAVVIVAEAIPAYVTGTSLDTDAHTARHLATWQIGFGVGLVVAAVMSRLTHAMLALAATFATLTVAATILDLATGHRGPWAESVHLIELVAVVLLWHLTPPDLFARKPPVSETRTDPVEGDKRPSLRLVPPDQHGN